MVVFKILFIVFIVFFALFFGLQASSSLEKKMKFTFHLLKNERKSLEVFEAACEDILSK